MKGFFKKSSGAKNILLIRVLELFPLPLLKPPFFPHPVPEKIVVKEPQSNFIYCFFATFHFLKK